MGSVFNRLPVEIRLKIWDPLVRGEFNGTTPSIIKALRQETNLYQEILELFYATNVYSLNSNNGLGFLDMSSNAILSITKVKIVIE